MGCGQKCLICWYGLRFKRTGAKAVGSIKGFETPELGSKWRTAYLPVSMPTTRRG